MNNYPLNIPEWFKEKTYKPENMSFVRVGDEGFVIDRSEIYQIFLADDAQNPECQKRWHYYYSITNPYRALRTETSVKDAMAGKNVHEKKAIVSLDAFAPYLSDDIEEIDIQDAIQELFPEYSDLTSANIQSLEEHIIAKLKKEAETKKLMLNP